MYDEAFVYDTYALVEIITGNENYREYVDKKIIINDFIFSELCYILIRDGYPNPEIYLDRYKKFVIRVDFEDIRMAMEFRYKNKKRKMSMVDCVSYFMSKKLGVKFLTGDKEFEDLDNVEFVKK